MGSFLTEVDGFTPIIDVLAAQVGLMTAAVYGVSWRYCQMSDGVCRASQETIAAHLGITRDTVRAHQARLCELGYLEDLTPDAQTLGRPHVYRDTGKAKIIGLLTAGTDDGVRVKPAGGADETRRGVRTDSAGGADETRTKRVLRENVREKEEMDASSLFWKSVCDELALITKQYARLPAWVESTEWANGTLTIRARTNGDWIDKRLRPQIERVARRLSGQPEMRLEVIHEED